ncbi:hypothetical protein B0A49_12331 [Cryomyces minteri]|uniref:HAT C-terminal dimerisation domain-containing protein n=1 Tax=Cryomyces minteri TaxID=331657 RepID=A0A4U0VLC7_9PEZI|nr:hypothetical protein B0A49_12331 [Cryomyces minteri]
MLRKELAEKEKVLNERRSRKRGKRAVIRDAVVLSTEKIRSAVVEAEDDARRKKAAKQPRKRKRGETVSEDEDNIIQEGLQTEDSDLEDCIAHYAIPYVIAAKKVTSELYTDYVAAAQMREQSAAEPSPPPEVVPSKRPRPRPDDSDSDEDYYNVYYVPAPQPITNQQQRAKRQRQETELQCFIEATDLEAKEYTNRPLAWWRDRGEVLYPTLATMAQAKKMVTDERFNLKADIVQADQCLKNWLRNGVAIGHLTLEVLERAIEEAVDDDGNYIADKMDASVEVTED